MNNKYSHIDSVHLGQKSDYIDKYDASLLQGIPRSAGRELIGVNDDNLVFNGFDLWTSFELSWLNKKGKPIVGIAEFKIPATSKNLIESKSFKLYLNSLNQSCFESVGQLQSVLIADLSEMVVGTVSVIIFDGMDKYSKKIDDIPGVCIDDLDIEVNDYNFDPNHLKDATSENLPVVTETLNSSLLKSNCLVTNQPDWGSVLIRYHGKQINREKLLRYIISFRQHNEFHEQCVERIFCDIKEFCHPQKLSVFARYTRRGGLDINPFRSDFETDSEVGRLVRQ